jgi:predicted transposase YbfD/YdcC
MGGTPSLSGGSDGHRREITAIPRLLQQLALAGCMVTIDAMGTQTEIAAQILDQEGDSALALKKNQGSLYHEVKETFMLAQAEQFAHVPYQFHQMVNKGHGRLEIRRSWTIADPDYLAYLDPKKRWKGVRSIGMVQAERRMARGDHARDPLLSAEFLLRQDVCSCGARPLGD